VSNPLTKQTALRAWFITLLWVGTTRAPYGLTDVPSGTVLGICFKAAGVELIAFSHNFASILVGANSSESRMAQSLLPHKGGLDERGDVLVRQFDLEPLASVIQPDLHGSTVLQRSVISIVCRNLTSPGGQNPVIVNRVMRV
jgi:hypothetical protein